MRASGIEPSAASNPSASLQAPILDALNEKTRACCDPSPVLRGDLTELLFIVETCVTPVRKNDTCIARMVGNLGFLRWSYSRN
jgi:hypothetical protein